MEAAAGAGLQEPSAVPTSSAAAAAATSSSSSSASSASSSASEQTSRFASLYNWLRYGGLPIARREPEAEAEADGALFGDGMAAAEPLLLASSAGSAASSSSSAARRGVFSLRRGGGAAAERRPAPPADPAHPLHNVHHPTLRLLRQRLADGSRPGARRDGFKLVRCWVAAGGCEPNGLPSFLVGAQGQ